MQKLRKCQACMKIQDREAMFKITKTQGSRLVINPNSGQVGRSCYVCKNADCIKTFIKKKRLQKSLQIKDLAAVYEIENSLKQLINI